MEKEMKITAPEGCEIEKAEIMDGVAVVTFIEKKPQLPKSWEEFCRTNRETKPVESRIMTNSSIRAPGYTFERTVDEGKNLLPDHATAEGVLALCQLIQLRNCYNGDWVPDWTDRKQKYVIQLEGGKITKFDWYKTASSPLFFKTIELRDEFLRNFSQLIEKLKPLYGIKEGGEE